jgi:hypothetical protein
MNSTAGRSSFSKEQSEGNADAPRIFLSFASEDQWWVDIFTRRAWFTDQLGPVRIENYKADSNLPFGELSDWIDKRVSQATAVVAFISKDYRTKPWTLVEWQKSLNERQRRQLIVVPIIMDNDAKVWWQALKREGKLFSLSDNYQFADFTDDNGSCAIITDNEKVISRIVGLAKEIRRVLGNPVSNYSPPVDKSDPTFIFLGHPTSRFSEEMEKQANTLDASLRSNGMSVVRWKDGWSANPASTKDSGASLFLQPLAPGEAANLSATCDHLTALNISDPRVILWLPAGYSDAKFEAAVDPAFSPSLSIPWPGPVLRSDNPIALASWLLREFLPLRDTEKPLVQVETVGELYAPDQNLEASQLSEQLTNEFCSIVECVVKPDATSPWKFWDTMFKEQIEQIKKIPGSRAIVAIHDLDIPRSTDPISMRKAMEKKFSRYQDDVKQAGADGLKLFWAALIFNNATALPFVDYPFNGRFKNWRLLRFERRDKQTDGSSMVPYPASLAVFKTRLADWVNR